jgi:hypothetical protein
LDTARVHAAQVGGDQGVGDDAGMRLRSAEHLQQLADKNPERLRLKVDDYWSS